MTRSLFANLPTLSKIGRFQTRWTRLAIVALLLVSLAACSLAGSNQGEAVEVEGSASSVAAAIVDGIETTPEVLSPVTRPATVTPVPMVPSTSTSSPAPTATATATATPVIKPANIEVEVLTTFGRKDSEAVHLQHPAFGQVFVLDELNLDTPFKISWTDDNPQTAVVRFRNADGVKVELTASVNPGRGEMPIEQAISESDQDIPRQQVILNSTDVFPVFEEIERLVTVELADEDGNVEPLQILFSRHDYEAGYTGPMALAQPQYDQLELGIDWRSEQYAPVGAFAAWLNNQPGLWNRVTITVEGRAPITWRDIREDSALLHQELAAAEYEDQIAFHYVTADGKSQQFARDQVPYYTKFEIVHSPRDEQEFYTLRAGRDPGVSEEMLQEMGEVVRHMFSNRPDYLHELALNRAIHSVAPGKDMRVLPEISRLPADIIDVMIDDEDFGVATGIALLERHEELSASAGYYFENEAPVLGFTLIHELVHQVQYMIYGPSWGEAVEGYYQNYMAMPPNKRIPDIDYYETSPWEWDALLTTAWFAQGSQLDEHIEPYLDLEVGETGTTVREHMQRRWGDPLLAYEGSEQ